MPCLVAVGEQVSIVWGCVDLEMVCQSLIRVNESILPGPADILPLGGHLGAGNAKNSDLLPVPGLIIGYSGFGNMGLGVESIKFRHSEFAGPSSCKKAGGQAGKDGGIEGLLQVKVLSDR